MSRFFYFLPVALILLCTAIYIPSFSVPFYLDDYESIVNNQAIHFLSWEAIDAAFPMRQLAYYSFALNFANGGTEVFGYHLVNFVLHLTNGLLVFFSVKLLVQTSETYKDKALLVAGLAAAVFLLLPLNTQAVTYIVQRITLLACLFYLAGIVSFLIFLRSKQVWCKALWLALAFICFIGGLHSKQNIVTLPISVFVISYALSSKKNEKYYIQAIAFSIAGLIAFHLLDFVLQLGIFDAIERLTVENSRLTRWEYFTHQLTSIWVYIYKFFIPYPLLLEYQVAPYTWSNWVTWLSLAAHIIVLSCAIKFRRQYSVLFCFVCLYYISHAVESSFIPIADLTVEHRTYLPNAFLAGVTALALIYLLGVYGTRAYVAISAALILFSYQTYSRNLLWNEPLEFYRQNLTHTKDNSRAYAAVGMLFAESGHDRNADKWLRMAIQVGAESGHMQMPTILNYVNRLYKNNDVNEATRISTLALKSATRNIDRSDVLVLLSKIKADQGLCDFSVSLFKRAKRLNPNLSQQGVSCVDKNISKTNL